MGIARFGWLVVLIPIAASAPALAQTPPAKNGQEVEEVVVTAAAPDADRSEIDRRSYSTAKTLQGQTGSLADLLRTVPSVDVDAQGNVSLRGDAAVQITIDGKPTGMFRGDARAQAIQSLPADQFARVEVITNPSAADSPEGTAGIINLVSRTARKAGRTGSARASIGSFGQYAGALNLSHSDAKLSLTGDVSLRGGDPQRFRVVDVRRTIGPAGESGQLIDTRFTGAGHILTSRLGADYDPSRATHLGAQLRYTVIAGSQPGFETLESRDPLGATSRSQRVLGASPFRNDEIEGSISLRRKLGADREFNADLRQDRVTNRFTRPDRASRLDSPEPDVFGLYQTGGAATTTALKSNYKRPFAGGGELKVGYEFQADANRYWTVIAYGPALGALEPDAGLTGAFEYRAVLHDAFVTAQRGWEDLTALAGLRLEDSRIEVRGAEFAGVRSHRVRPYPSLHLSYRLDEQRKLTGSYSRRIERANPFLLNPVTSFRNAETILRGNPRLKPTETDSFEVGYEDGTAGKSQTLTLFYRRIHDPVMRVTRDLGGGVLLSTPENVGHASRAGASASVNRKLTSRLTASLSGDVYWARIRSLSAPDSTRAGFAGTGRASVSWEASPADLLQADMRATSRTQTPQGYRTSPTVVNLGYRRRLTRAVFLTLTVENALDQRDSAEVVRTAALLQRQSYRALGRRGVMALTYNFGGGAKPPSAPAIDFGGGGAP